MAWFSPVSGMFFDNLLIWLSIFLQGSIQGPFYRAIFLNHLCCRLLRVTFPWDTQTGFLCLRRSSSLWWNLQNHGTFSFSALLYTHPLVDFSREFGFVRISTMGKWKPFQAEGMWDPGLVWLGPSYGHPNGSQHRHTAGHLSPSRP